MRFRVALVTAAAALAIASSPAKAYFFFFIIPGQALERIEGKKGQNCVSPAMKVGDQIRSVNGDILTVKSLSGTSVRCKQPERPILAELEFTASATFSAKAGIELPDSFKPKPLNNIQRFNGGLLDAKDDARDIGIYISSVRRDFVLLIVRSRLKRHSNARVTCSAGHILGEKSGRSQTRRDTGLALRRA